MRLSIVIPCYNMQAYLPQCLDSLLDQDLAENDYEIIVVNDGSKDDTLAIAMGYSEKYPQVQVVDKANAGVGAARNSGLDRARGRYLYFLDPDDYLVRDCLVDILAKAENLDVDILTFRSQPVEPNEYNRDPNSTIQDTSPEVIDGITYIATYKFANEIWWYLLRKDFLTENQLRFIEGKWMEDAILTAQLFCAANAMAHTTRDVHRYRILPTSAMRNKSPEHYNKVIFDNANAAYAFDELIRQVPVTHKESAACIKRLKTRQQSFVFFLLVRLMKSDLPVSKIPEMLEGFEKIGAYPLNKFLGKDYHGFSYSFMVYIFNHKSLIKPFISTFRPLYSIVR